MSILIVINRESEKPYIEIQDEKDILKIDISEDFDIFGFIDCHDAFNYRADEICEEIYSMIDNNLIISEI